MQIKFWGTRGSTPTPDPDHMKYGGDTTCVEIRTSGGKRLILDTGTGIRRLGMELITDSNGPISSDILLTHGHWDHIQGFPFFAPAFVPGNSFTFFGLFKADGRVEESLRGLMGELYFPVHFEAIARQLHFQDILEGTREIQGITVSCCVVNHPQGALAYRIEHEGSAVVFCPDTEHTPDDLQPKLIELCQDAEYLIHDSHFAPEDYEKYRNWGHSTYETGIAVCKEAGVRTLVLFHHAPEHDDDFMDDLLYRANQEWPHCVAATRDLELFTHRTDTRQFKAMRPDREVHVSGPEAGFQIERRFDTIHVQCPASITVFSSSAFGRKIVDSVKEDTGQVTMDFKKVERLNSVCLGILGKILSHTQKNDVPLIFENVNEVVLEVLRVTRFTEVVEVV
jgi:phosphoribosyl 1,2-cyclic phosphodiesterase/anti-anti-sigma regulatory factor